MVTAILPSMTASAPRMDYEDDEPTTPISDHIEAPSISSELTITPARIGSRPTALSERHATSTGAASPTRLAGIVGMFTGCGALVALALFLRLPTIFRRYDTDAGQALADAYYVVGTIAFFVALCCFFGLRKLKGEEGRSWRAIYRCVTVEAGSPQLSKFMSYRILLLDSLRLGLQNDLIGLGYLGAFVARASSVCISLFIPLSVNNYFTSSGKCRTDDLANIKEQCHEAYVLAAQLTGTSQLIGLICAPLFGYLADRYQRFHLPLLVAAICGIAGYGSFAGLKSPESDGQSGSHSVFVIVALLGISQIGCIVCSLGLLGRGILGLEDQSSIRNSLEGNRRFREVGDGTDNENRALLTGQNAEKVFTIQLKGSIAGVYSFAGGIGILFLTKLGGFLFDAKSPASPFYMLAGFNTLLLVVLVLRGMVEALGEKKDA
ncbi:hypothetical protein MMC13_006169 [Lambiella insularis]|nr:hypothetical protein [Lambiella insularis]